MRGPNNVFLRVFGSNLLLRNFSPNCTNTKTICFSIHTNLFMLWGVQITYFWDCLDRIFYYVTCHQIVETLRKFDFRFIESFLRSEESKKPCFWDLLDWIFYYVSLHQIVQTLRKFDLRFIAMFLRSEELWNVILRLFGSNLLLRNFSPNFTNTKKICFSIHRKLFTIWGVQITCFWDILDRIFYNVTFHKI